MTGQCSNPAEAMLLKSLLEANNIPAYVPQELTTQAALDFAGSGRWPRWIRWRR